jgi:hypothetical protein
METLNKSVADVLRGGYQDQSFSQDMSTGSGAFPSLTTLTTDLLNHAWNKYGVPFSQLPANEASLVLEDVIFAKQYCLIYAPNVISKLTGQKIQFAGARGGHISRAA